MKWISRAHEDVIAAVGGIQPKRIGHLLEIADDVIGLLLRRAIVLLRRALDIDAVLVGAGEKKRFDSLLTFRTRNRVRYDHRIEMAEVRQAVSVVDGRGDVEGLHQRLTSVSFGKAAR